MGDYIKRDAACAAMPDDYYGWRDKQIMNFIPAADVVPVRWIPVTERLPKKRDYYLVFTQANETYVCDFIPSVNQWWIEPCDNRLGNVTHWMPLPEPPKEE